MAEAVLCLIHRARPAFSGGTNRLTDDPIDHIISSRLEKKGLDCLAPASEGAKPLRV